MNTPTANNGTPANNSSYLTLSPYPSARSEPELRQLVAEALRASGISVNEQVACPAGAADIVTADRTSIIEVKLDLTRKHLYSAIGQVLLYRAAINPQARAIVLGYATEETAGLIDWAAAIGVEVICWNADDGQLKSELAASIASIPTFSLQWNIQTLAQSHGIMRVADLARFLGVSRQSLYGIWRGTAVNVSVARLEQLARRLGPTPDVYVRPGSWFRWQNGRLHWAIKERAEQLGLDTAQLAFAAHLYPQQIDWFWSGEARFVFLDTLARLASVLETTEQPFDVGELFVKAAY